MNDDVLWIEDPYILIDKIAELSPYGLPKNRKINALMRIIAIILIFYMLTHVGISNILLFVVVIIVCYMLLLAMTEKTNTFIGDQIIESNLKNNTLFAQDERDRIETYSELWNRPDCCQPVLYYDHMDALGLYNANF
jgi:hypothetical protein